MTGKKQTRGGIVDLVIQVVPWLVIISVGVFVLLGGDSKAEIFTSDSERAAFDSRAGVHPSGSIILLVTEWCPACKALQATLDQQGVQYSALDIEQDDEARGLFIRCLEKGAPNSVPKVIYGRHLVSQGELFDRLAAGH